MKKHGGGGKKKKVEKTVSVTHKGKTKDVTFKGTSKTKRSGETVERVKSPYGKMVTKTGGPKGMVVKKKFKKVR